MQRSSPDFETQSHNQSKEVVVFSEKNRNANDTKTGETISRNGDVTP